MAGDDRYGSGAYIQVDGSLFEAVQQGRVFEDSKTFVDCIPREDPALIMERFEAERGEDGFDLRSFVERYFILPEEPGEPAAVADRTVMEHIRSLWDVLIQQPSSRRHAFSTLLPLPHRYVVPGGRFRESYYWDSYFTAVGLAAEGDAGVVEDMVRNAVQFISMYGFVPTANRVYYRSRSQPPFLTFMLDLLASGRGVEAVAEFIPAVEQEYAFWMDGADRLRQGERRSHRRVVDAGEAVLNRFWDDDAEPRPEAYREDCAVASRSTRPDESVFRDIRAACESGWDFSSRWFGGKGMASIRTTDILPVDLNALLYHVENRLASWNHRVGDDDAAEIYRAAAVRREEAIQKYFWDEEHGFFFDYDWEQGERTGTWSLAAAVPLFVGVASQEQASAVASVLENRFLREGGLVATLQESGQQWDSPNGWAPLHWMAVNGLARYGEVRLAREIGERWLRLNRDVFQRTGLLLEKYDVCSPGSGAGGEYELQDGFGWTNGVAVALYRDALIDEAAELGLSERIDM